MNRTETKKTVTKRLTLTRQTLRTLTSDELRLVAGGAPGQSNSGGASCYQARGAC